MVGSRLRRTGWDVSATPFRRWTIRRRRFGDKNIGRFGDRRHRDLCVTRTFRRYDLFMIIFNEKERNTTIDITQTHTHTHTHTSK